MIYICDFETTTDAVSVAETKIYLWGSISLHGKNRFKFDCDLFSFFKWLENPKYFVTKLYFHNLNFDGRFIVSYLVNKSDYIYSTVIFKNAIRFKNSKDWLKIKGRKLFNVSILGGQLYAISLFLRNRLINIVCSVKILVSSVEKIGKSLNILKKKNIDYNKYAYFKTEKELLFKTAERKLKRNDDFFYFSNIEQLIKHSNHKTKKLCDEENKCIICYLYYDLLIIKKAIILIKKEGKINFKLTISSTAFAHFKKWFQTEIGTIIFFKWFGGKPWNARTPINVLSLYDWELVKKSYSGGLTAFKNNIINKNIEGEIYSYDINSLYPSVMKNEHLPYGEMLSKKPWRSNYVTLIEVNITYGKMLQKFIDLNYPAFFRKKNEITELNPNNQNEHFIYEFYQPIDNHFVFWKEEWLFLNKYYKFKFKNYKEYYFQSSNYFKDYIEKMKSFKENATGALRMFYKIFLNSIYGKFGEKYQREQTVIVDIKKLGSYVFNKSYQTDNFLSDYEYEIITRGYYDWKYNDNKFLKNNLQKSFIDKDNTVFFVKKKPKIELGFLDRPTKKNFSYIPLASFITMKARMKLCTAILNNIKSFLYADTDSLYLTEEAKSIILDDNRFGDWKFCGLFNRFKVIRSKCYGMRYWSEDESTHKNIFVVSNLRQQAAQKHLNWNNFKRGTVITKDNLRSFKVHGGALLMPLEIKL